MTKELRDYLIKTYGLKDDVKDRVLELTYPREIAAYEAGYEAGRPKWHDMLKDHTDLPPRGTVGDDVLNVSIIVLDQDGNRCFYDYVNNNWINAEDDSDWYIKEDYDEYVYCWCEKPKCKVSKLEE